MYVCALELIQGEKALDTLGEKVSMEGNPEDSDEDVLGEHKATVLWEKCIQQSIFVDLSEDESLHFSDLENSLALHLSQTESASSDASIHLSGSAELSDLDDTSSESSIIHSQSERVVENKKKCSILHMSVHRPNTMLDELPVNLRVEDPGENTSDEDQEDLPFDSDFGSPYFNQTGRSEVSMSSDGKETVQASPDLPGLLELTTTNGDDIFECSVSVEHNSENKVNLWKEPSASTKHCNSCDVSKPGEIAPSCRAPVDINQLLLLHFSQEELLQSGRLIEAETLPEVSLLESLDDSLFSLGPTQNSTAIENNHLESPAFHTEIIQSICCGTTDEKTDTAEIKSSSEEAEGKNNNNTSSNADSLSSKSTNTDSNQTSGNDGALDGEREEKAEEDGQDSRVPFVRTRFFSEMKYGQGQVHYPLPDFSKVSPKVKIPKAPSGPARDISTSTSTMHRAQSSAGMLEVISRVLEDSVLPSEKPYIFKEEDKLTPPALVHHLQAEYDKLLTKYAEAENLIDQMRLGTNVKEFKLRISNVLVSTAEQQMMFKSMMEAQDQLERNYISKKEEHRALEMQNYIGLSRNTGTFDPDRSPERSQEDRKIHTNENEERIEVERNSVLSDETDHCNILFHLNGFTASSRHKECTPQSSYSTLPSVLDAEGKCDLSDCVSLAVEVSRSYDTPADSETHSPLESPFTISSVSMKMSGKCMDSNIAENFKRLLACFNSESLSLRVQLYLKPLLQVNYGSCSSLPASYKVMELPLQSMLHHSKRFTQSDTALLPSNVYFQRTFSPLSVSSKTGNRTGRRRGTKICAAQNDIALSVFTVTSKSLTVQWSGLTGASSYKITATPKYSSKRPVFAQFGGNTVIGSVNSLSPNTVYTVQLEAIDNALNVLSSAKTEETTAPDIPIVVEAYSKISDSMTVVFSEVSGATSYILRAETDDFFSETPVSSSPGTILQLQPFTDYKLSVMSVNSGGRSQPSEIVIAKTVVVAPQLNTTSPANDSIRVTWLPVDNAVLYTLCIIQEGSSTRVKVNTTDITLTFNNLAAGVTYCIQGTAWDSQGRTGDHVNVCQITRPPSPDVIDVQVSQGRSLGITVYWVAVPGANNYIAWTSNGRNCTTTDNNYCYIIPVECGQNRSVSVTAYNAAGPSSPSQPAHYITYPCLPDNLWVEEPNPGNCSLRWDNVQLVDYYMAFIKRDDGTERSCNTTETTCSFFCACGYTYLVTVFPYNQAGSSPYANVRNYTTSRTTPSTCFCEDVTIQLISTDTLEVMWSPVKGAEVYETTAAQTNNVIHCNDTSPVCALSDLRCNTAYSVMVTPCSELRGCNRSCPSNTRETAPCTPEILNITQTNSSTYSVFITNPNIPNTNYTITAIGRYDTHTCQTRNNSCELTQLPCGSTYEVMTVATTAAGRSLPGYEKVLETGPCCPVGIKLYRRANNSLRVIWHSLAPQINNHTVEINGTVANYTCTTDDSRKYCDFQEGACGEVFTVVVAPIQQNGIKVSFCQPRTYSVISRRR
ncbi:Fibronectin type III domain-containing protein 7 Precursor [Channa argus]|uniref:Fibronectin type III domain-containing protein 7 n=1 Tax=Channa argus TaxID=215402 RepID=A0A6G1Q9Q1_CHAAH|nr:Fibronectin type III domain-containing protein 7 Precursor [Channa argus]